MVNILCLSNSRDIATQEAVGQHIKRLGAKFNIERLDDISNNYSFLINENGKSNNKFGRFHFDSNKALSVWHRRVEFLSSPDFYKKIEKSFSDENSRKFFQSEYILLIGNLYRLLSNAYWVNSLPAYLSAQGKIRNLEVAASLGMHIPPSILSNVVSNIIEFSKTYTPNILIKPLNSFEIREKNSLAHCVARKISLSDVLLNSKAISLAPVFLQKYIEKELELRVIVIGEKVFSVAIFSQEHERGKEDWRCAPLNELRYEPFTLPTKIELALIKFNNFFELSFGVFDLILSKSGDIYFLECNTDGEWYWLEMATHLPISLAVAENLVENSKNPK